MTRTIGAAFIVLSIAGLVAGGFLLGQRFGGPFAAATTPPGLAPGQTAGPDAGSPPPDGLVATLIGAGDIAECATTDDDRTADLVDSLPGLVFTAGDNAYDVGSAGEFRKCYDPTNFTKNFRGSTNLFDGFEAYDKNMPLKLSEDGRKELAEVIKELGK